MGGIGKRVRSRHAAAAASVNDDDLYAYPAIIDAIAPPGPSESHLVPHNMPSRGAGAVGPPLHRTIPFVKDCLDRFGLKRLKMPTIDGRSCMYAAIVRDLQLEQSPGPMAVFEMERAGSDITLEQQEDGRITKEMEGIVQKESLDLEAKCKEILIEYRDFFTIATGDANEVDARLNMMGWGNDTNVKAMAIYLQRDIVTFDENKLNGARLSTKMADTPLYNVANNVNMALTWLQRNPLVILLGMGEQHYHATYRVRAVSIDKRGYSTLSPP